MFTLEQRRNLNALSKLLYGSESRWAKEFARGGFNMPEGTEEVTEKVETVQVKNGKGGRLGTITTRATALAQAFRRGGTKAMQELDEKVPETRTRTIQKFRAPSYDEIVKAFEQMIDAQRIGKMPREEMIQVLAYRYATNTLGFPVSLVSKEGGEKDVEDILKTVPEDRRQAVQDMIHAEGKTLQGLPLDAFQFISDVVFAINHADKAEAMAVDSLQAVDVGPSKPKIPYAMAQTFSMGESARNVSAATKAARRAKNKAARAARRRNRSA